MDRLSEFGVEGLWPAPGLDAGGLDTGGLDAGGLDPVSRLWRIATWEYDATTDVVYWFDDPGEVLHLAEAVSDALLEPVLVAVRHGAPWEQFDLDRSLEDLDGTAVDLRIQARLLRDGSGAPSGCVGIVSDVSEQRRSEQALRGVLDRYRRLVELSPEPVVVHQDGLIRYMNPAGLRMAGAESITELVGRPILDFIHVTSLEETLERISTLTEPGMVTEPSEAVLVSIDGTPSFVESTSVLIEWEGRPAYQVILRDVAERQRAEAALRYQASLVMQVSDAVVATDADGRITSWNPAAEALYGWRAADAIDRSLRDVLGEWAVEADGSLRAGEVEHHRAQGESISVLVSVAPLRDQLGDQTGTVAVCTDLTERIERRAAEARYQTVVAALDEGIMVIDRDGVVMSVNDAARAMLGDHIVKGLRLDAEAIVNRWRMFTEGGEPISPEEHPVAIGLRTGQPQSRTVVGFAEGDTVLWLSIAIQPLKHHPGGAVVCSFTDITERKLIADELTFQATHDPLTRLPNRDPVLEKLGEAVAATRRGDDGVGLLLLDLDRFKTINDSFGHAVGDRVLQVVAQRIAATLRTDDVLGRLAGDEFVAVCPRLRSSDALPLAERIAAAVRAPLQLPSGRELVVTASIGIACVDTEVSPEVALSHADVAMYRAKELGRARVEVFDDELRSAVSRRLLIHEGLRGAVDSHEITTQYQPMVCATTGRALGVEVLARWEHRTLGQIGPAEFIPIAEDTGLMAPLGSRILHRACVEISRWEHDGRCGPDLSLNVNLSPRQLADPDLVSTVAHALEVSALDADRLWLEVTESVLMADVEQVSGALEELRSLGVHFAIDDFGTGYSSLMYLKRFPVEALKIDKSFVDGLGSDPESEAIVAATIGLAQSLSLTTIAEGVETEAQADRLRELGCDQLQGYLFGRPMWGQHIRLT
jgi:diguanylate cyclase (GGDEF)-like protein/PAS domain S-box-containing protein